MKSPDISALLDEYIELLPRAITEPDDAIWYGASIFDWYTANGAENLPPKEALKYVALVDAVGATIMREYFVITALEADPKKQPEWLEADRLLEEMTAAVLAQRQVTPAA